MKIEITESVAELLLCTHDPIFLKSLYGMLREEGFGVDVVEHTSIAVQRAFHKDYAAVILDSESIGFPAQDAAEIIRISSRDATVIIAGKAKLSGNALAVEKPVDLEEFRALIRSLWEQEKSERKEGGP